MKIIKLNPSVRFKQVGPYITMRGYYIPHTSNSVSMTKFPPKEIGTFSTLNYYC